jgi:MFS family permease
VAQARPLTGALGLVATAALPILLTGSLAPELRQEFAFGDAALGVAVGIFFAASAIASTPAGRLVARVGAPATVRLTATLSIGCYLGVTLFAGSATSLIALLAIGGLGNAVSSPAASAVLTSDLTQERQGVGYGALTAGAPIGSVLAGLALPLVAHPFGWRAAYVAGAVLTLLAALVAGVRVRHVGESPAAPAPATAAAPSSAPQAAILRVRGREWNSVHTLALAAALASAASTGLISFLVVYSIDSGMGADAAGVLLATTGLAAAVARIGLGTLADREPQKAPAGLLALLVGASAGFLLMVSGTPVLIAVGALVAGGLGWGWAGLMNLIAVREGSYDPAEAVGIVMSGLFLGALSGPVLIGLIARSVGFELAWILAAASVLAAAATLVAAHPLTRASGEGSQ